MSKKIDFRKSLSGLNEQDLTAKIKEDELRMKKLSFAHAFHRWRTRKAFVL